MFCLGCCKYIFVPHCKCQFINDLSLTFSADKLFHTQLHIEPPWPICYFFCLNPNNTHTTRRFFLLHVYHEICRFMVRSQNLLTKRMFVESVLFFAKQKKNFQHQMTKSGAILTIDGHKESFFFFFYRKTIISCNCSSYIRTIDHEM